MNRVRTTLLSAGFATDYTRDFMAAAFSQPSVKAFGRPNGADEPHGGTGLHNRVRKICGVAHNRPDLPGPVPTR